MEAAVGGADHNRVAVVETAIIGSEFVVMVPSPGEGTDDHHSALREAASRGFSLLQEEYWDADMDCSVYVFTRQGEGGS